MRKSRAPPLDRECIASASASGIAQQPPLADPFDRAAYTSVQRSELTLMLMQLRHERACVWAQNQRRCHSRGTFRLDTLSGWRACWLDGRPSNDERRAAVGAPHGRSSGGGTADAAQLANRADGMDRTNRCSGRHRLGMIDAKSQIAQSQNAPTDRRLAAAARIRCR